VSGVPKWDDTDKERREVHVCEQMDKTRDDYDSVSNGVRGGG